MRLIATIVSLASFLLQTTSHTDVHIQQMVLTVTDNSEQFVGGLRAQDFVIQENGERKGVARFLADSDTPVSVGVLIDTSLSMATSDGGLREPRWSAAIGATRALLHLLKPQDEFMLMTFNSSMTVVQGFTTGQNKIESLLREIRPDGYGTDLFGSVDKALKEVKNAHNRRRGLVVITDAEDNEGFSLTTLRSSIYTQELPVFTFALRPKYAMAAGGFGGRGLTGRGGFGGAPPATPTVTAALDTLSGEDKRRFLMLNVERLQDASTPGQIVQFVYNIVVELRGQYTLGYYSDVSGPVWERVIRVQTIPSGLHVHIRRETMEPDQ
jgi:hypothetical protein